MQKYIVCKKDYLTIKKHIIGGSKKYNYYVTHSSFSLKNLLAIISDGKIKLGKDLPEEYRTYGGEEPSEYIYANIYFDDLKNMNHLLNYTLILHPKILENFDVIVNEGWQGRELTEFKKNDSNSARSVKLLKIKQFLKTLNSLPEMLRQSNLGFHHHELLFSKPIKLKKYIIAISCTMCNDDVYDNIKNKLNINNYANVKIFKNNIPPSTIDLNI